MTKTDPVADCIRESLSAASPHAEQAVRRAFCRIRRRERLKHTARALVPLACAFLLLLILPHGIKPSKDDILSNPSASLSPSPEPPETETVYISSGDPYYHAFEKCVFIKGEAEPIMERVAKLNMLYPCPVCCIFEAKQPLMEAIAIGDIVIMRYEDEYLYDQELTSVFGFDFPDEYEGSGALSKVPSYLHGGHYRDFMNAVNQNSSASFTARMPDILYLYPYEIVSEINDPYNASLKYSNQLKLHSRYIGSSHYALYFPDFEIGQSIGAYSRINGEELIAHSDGESLSLTGAFTEQTVEKIVKFDVRYMDESNAWHSFEDGNLACRIYYTGNEYVLVINEKYADPYLLEKAYLRIGENEFTVNGFMDTSGSLEELAESHAYYAVVLTEQEAKSIQNGAGISLEHLDFSAIAQASPYAYIPIQYGTGAYGVMDKTGEFVIAPEYKDAWSYQDLSGLYASGVTGPIILKDYSDTLYLYDGETLDLIAFYSLDGSNSSGFPFPRSARNSINIESPGLYELRRDEGVYLLNRKGEVLMSFLYDKTGNFENNLYYSATFLHEAVGYPDRIVLYEQKDNYAPDRMWISDLNGKRISKDFERLIPLIWTDKRAVFITVTYDREAAEKDFYLPYYEKGLPFSGYEKDKTFRVGLVDQNGEEIAECKYIALEIIDDQIHLTEENGEKTIVSLSR